ncbi:hypothetical protein DPMN_106342 [Dreissena polymorpha]|uniref:Uncharacterized protein n=1 Tax=Dreissena polymorpha TaxID=45954 RepID=A0A9D4QJN0_DREPO|nr:hypothetical protein DPMN_106342 [Dreissena polymorpha]
MINKTAPSPAAMLFQLTGTIFEQNSHIKETNVLSKFHENWAKNVTSTVFTCFHFKHIEKNAPPLAAYINKTNVLTNFHDDWVKIVTSRPNRENFHYIHLEKNAPPTGGHVFSPIPTIFKTLFTRENCHYIHVHIEKNAPPTGGHVFSQISTIFESSETSIEPMKTAPPTGGHVFQRIGTTFELNQDIIKTNILTNVTSTVFTSFELGRDFIEAKLLTKFHEDGTRNVASRVFTSKC